MVIIGNTLVSEDLFDQEFICNLSACKGACCIEGDSGAPVTEEEKGKIEKSFESIRSYLDPRCISDIESRGGFEKDEDDEWVTTCLKTGECNYSVRDQSGILGCGIENAFRDGKSEIRKPVSCYLYPVRVTKVGDYEALNYHRWEICKPACALGKKERTPVYEFLKQPLTERFGEAWYEEMCLVAQALKEEGLNP